MLDWRDIPSLSALRAFHVMAHHGSYSAAARELNVTHAAIAQHVRSLEAELAQTLVRREGRGMALTATGRALAEALQTGFTSISDGVSKAKTAGMEQPLKIALTPSFAENWLMPRLGDFWKKHPDIQLALVPGFELVDLDRDGFDLAIRYGRGDWDRVESESLVISEKIVVATPELACDKPCGDIRQLAHLPWLFSNNFGETSAFLREQGLCLDDIEISEFATNSMVLAATRAGYGLSVQGKALIEQDLEDGRLVCLFQAAKTDLGYYILTRTGRHSPKLDKLMTWLREVR